MALKMEGGQVLSPGLFGDIVSHLPDCCSFIRIGVGCGRALSQRPSQRKPLSVFDTCPAKLVIWHPVIPNGSYPLDGPRQNPPRVRLVSWCLGTQIGLGRGRQNERDLAMVKDPLIDFEEVVVGMRSLGSNPMARGDISRRFFQFTVP